MLELLADLLWAAAGVAAFIGLLAFVDTAFFDDRGERWLARKLEREP